MIAATAAVLVLGCQARPSATGTASASQPIQELTNQTLVYTCPNCGMDFEAAGKCSMCGVDLVETRVSYLCPADEKPVEHSGKCPRCDANAKIVKTAAVEGGSGAAPSSGTDAPTATPGGGG